MVVGAKRDRAQQGLRPIIRTTRAQLQSRESLHSGEIIRIDLERGFVRSECFVDASGPLECERKVDPRIGMAGHQLARPFELVGCVIQQAVLEMNDASGICGWDESV